VVPGMAVKVEEEWDSDGGEGEEERDDSVPKHGGEG
jgi:hypothetical protein